MVETICPVEMLETKNEGQHEEHLPTWGQELGVKHNTFVAIHEYVMRFPIIQLVTISTENILSKLKKNRKPQEMCQTCSHQHYNTFYINSGLAPLNKFSLFSMISVKIVTL